MKNATVMFISYSIILFGLISASTSKQPEQKSSKILEVEKLKPVILKKIPHDSTAFTQGLFYNGGKLYESTGIYGQSTIRIVDTTGRIEKKQQVPNVFAEGCALLGTFLYQITWKEQLCFLYAFPSLKLVSTLTYKGEGWGLTEDGSFLYMSNGSDTITVRNAKFEIQRQLPVTLAGKPLININELELANGKIYANVWFSDYIFVINISSGFVEQIVDCLELVAIENPSSDQNVLNGIAVNKSNGTFYITGKNWKNMFQVKIPN